MRFRPSLYWVPAALALGLTAPATPARAAHTVLAAVPISRMSTPWWRARFDEKQQELRRRKPDLIFLGDSITHDWEKSGPPSWCDFKPGWDRFYGDRNAVNLGFKGDATSHLLWRMEHGELDGIDPKVAVVLIGANDFGRVHWSAEDTVLGIERVVDVLRQRLPRTRVLLISILPSERSAWVSESTAKANRLLAERYGHAESGVSYVDVTPVFAPGGHFDRSLFLDPLLTPPEPPLHPTAQAQNRLSAAIEPTLARLMGDRPHGP